MQRYTHAHMIHIRKHECPRIRGHSLFHFLSHLINYFHRRYGNKYIHILYQAPPPLLLQLTLPPPRVFPYYRPVILKHVGNDNPVINFASDKAFGLLLYASGDAG